MSDTASDPVGTTPRASRDVGARPGQGRNLALALLAFTITFWAWNVIAPLGVRYTEALGLSATQKSLLVATPVLVGSLGRIVTGALTDRIGGRLMFTVLTSAAPKVPVSGSWKLKRIPLRRSVSSGCMLVDPRQF